MASEPPTPPPPLHERRYEYDALPDSRSIRILTLHPSADPSAPLTGTLTSAPLDGPPVSYETISYAWGTGPRSLALYILDDADADADDGHTRRRRRALPLTQSIHDALCRVRRADDAHRRLWADQVCINQEDLAERGRQVRLMNAVFKGAARTLVWLGRDDEGVAAEAVRMVERLDGVFRDDEAHERFRRAHSEGLAEQRREPWVPLSKLTRLPWFHRIWIVQEIGTSAPATLFWGAARLDWATLSSVADVLNQRYHHLRTRFAVGTPNIRYLYRRFVEPAAYDEHHNRGSFVYELHRARHMLARDPRDHVYAFLGHFSVQKGSWALRGLAADYARPVGDVYVDVAVRVLRGATSLILLSATHNAAAGFRRAPLDAADLSLPSWVPDWRVLPVHLVGSPETPHRAAGDTQPQLTIDEDRRVLHIRGFRIDTIARRSWVFYGKAFQFRQTGPGNPIEVLWQSLCGHETFSLDEQYPGSGHTAPSASASSGTDSTSAGGFESSAFFALVQTLTNACIGADRSRPYASIPARTWLAHGASYLLRSGVASDRIAPCVRAAARAARADPFKWSHEATLVSRYRRFGVTRRAGYYVMGPDAMDEGDAVVVLHGGRTPFVLRRRQDGGDGWTLVGECYVHGIMNGEALLMPDRREEVFSIH